MNPTLLAGLLSFATATAACLAAAKRAGARDALRWNCLALANCVFFIETYLGLRYRAADLARAIAVANDVYDQRKLPLEIIDILLAAMALALIILIWIRRATQGVRVAAGITVALAALFAIESVSLHALDAVFYRPVGPVVVIGWLWAVAAAGICVAAIQS